MKKILLLMCTIFVSFTSYSQEKFAEYQMEYFSSRSYDIEVGKPDKKGQYDTYIDIQSSGKTDQTINIILNNNKINPLKEAINKAKEKYVEWRQVAIDNQVDKVTKKVDVKFPAVQVGFFYGSEWRFDFSVGLSARFLVIDGEKHLLIIDTDEVVASDNQFMKAEGYIVFSSVEEIDHFLEVLDAEAIGEFATKRKSAEELFE